MPSQDKPSFRVAARVLRQLGAELITSDEIALNELVKNAFDARSPRVSIEVISPLNPIVLRRTLEQLKKERIGPEAALREIHSAFPGTMSTDQRADELRPFREASSTSKKLIVFTEKYLASAFRLCVSDTGAGMTMTKLRDAFLVIGTPNKWMVKGTDDGSGKVTLGEKGIGRLSMMRLGRFVTVTSSVKGETRNNKVRFDWRDFEDPNLFLEDVRIDVEIGDKKDADLCGTSIEITGLYADWDESKITEFVDSYVRRLEDPLVEDLRPYPIDILFNGTRQNIPRLAVWLRDRFRCRGSFTFDPRVKSEEVALTSGIRWFGNSTDEPQSWLLEQVAHILECSEEDVTAIGPIKVKFLWFNRAQFKTDPDISATQLRDELNVWCGGFAIYRDGFRVGQTGGMEDDWLQMDKTALKSSGYSLNRYQTVGSLAISSKLNPALVDAANREGLVDCPQYELLRRLMQRIVVKTLKMQIATVQEAEKKATTEAAVEDSLKRSKADVSKAVKTLNRVIRAVPEAQRRELDEVRNSLEQHSQTIDVLGKALDQSRETRIEVLELAGIGLVVEIVVHELARLTESAELLLLEATRDSKDPKLSQVAKSLREQFKVTNKRIRTVDAMSPSGRNRKESFDVVGLVSSVLSGYSLRFKRHQIHFKLTLDGKETQSGLVVKMVQGLVAQTIENLVQNSVYWLKQFHPVEPAKRMITIDVDSKAMVIEIADNGPGIDPEQREKIFRPYFSLRPRGKGLGLFIASEIARYHGGRLYLDTAPGRDGRLHTFILEMPKESKSA
ncbi:MAG TPA: sensor histidine kinase [Usitatibacteraceae bacterium]